LHSYEIKNKKISIFVFYKGEPPLLSLNFVNQFTQTTQIILKFAQKINKNTQNLACLGEFSVKNQMLENYEFSKIFVAELCFKNCKIV